jgi:hypothetical protein
LRVFGIPRPRVRTLSTVVGRAVAADSAVSHGLDQRPRLAPQTSREAIDRALTSEVRAQSRKVTKGLLALYDGTVFHTVVDAAEYPLAAA